MPIEHAVVIIDPAGIAALDGVLERVTANLTEDVASDARRRCPVDTGELVESIHTEVLGTIGRVWVGTDHWAPTEFGSQPHIIRSHGNYSLHNKETGQYFGRVVHHPGTPEQAFLRPALYTPRVPRV